MNSLSHAGCQLLAELMQQTGFRKEAKRLGVKKIKLGFSDADFVQLFVILLATGHSDFEAVREVRRDSVIRHLLGIRKLPHTQWQGQVLQSYIPILKPLHSPDHRGVMNRKIR